MNGSDPSAINYPSPGNRSQRGPLSHLEPIAQVMISLGIFFVLYIMVSLGSDGLLSGVFGVDTSSMLQDMDGFLAEHGDALNTYRFIQITSTFLIFGVSALLASYLFTGTLLGIFDFKKEANVKSLFYVPLIILLAFPVITLIYFYVSQIPMPDKLVQLEEGLEQFTMAMLSDPSVGIFLINFLMIAIMPAIFEEMLFRGVIQRLTGKAFNSPHIGIILSGLLFGLIHGQIFKFLPIAVLGILLGYLYYWTRNLWFPILAHFFHNGIQVVLYFIVARGWVEMDIESEQMLPPLQSAVFAVLFVGVMYLFYNANRKTADEPI